MIREKAAGSGSPDGFAFQFPQRLEPAREEAYERSE
jgi:hypothetical protein